MRCHDVLNDLLTVRGEKGRVNGDGGRGEFELPESHEESGRPVVNSETESGVYNVTNVTGKCCQLFRPKSWFRSEPVRPGNGTFQNGEKV